MKKLKIGFMGTPDFSVPALEALLKMPHDIVCVYTQPPRPKGRGHKTRESPVHLCALRHDIPVYTPKNFKSEEARTEFQHHDLDVAIVVAYGLILPQAVLDMPRHGCINIHASLLPRWRGASPIQQAIWAGDEKTGTSIMKMDAGLDTGPVIAIQDMQITGETTAGSLHDFLSAQGAQMIVAVMETLAQTGVLEAQAQDDANTTYAPLLKKLDGLVDWTQSAQAIDRQVRALNPWPGVYTHHDGARLKIHAAALTDQTSSLPAGTILDRKGHVVCGDRQVLQLTQIQPHGAKRMDFASAVNGGLIEVGAVLS